MNEYNNNPPILIDSIVCFTDILGFSTLNNSLTTHQQNKLLQNLHLTLNSQYEIIRQTNPIGHFKTFTDNIILAYPFFDDNEGRFGSILMTLVEYQLNMTLKGYFLRGGISIGQYYGDETFAYGPALVDSYRLESTIAVSPRIILSSQTSEMMQTYSRYYHSVNVAPHYNYILKDEDNIYFLNYLYHLKYHLELDNNFDWYMGQIRLHKSLIIDRLNEYNTKLIESPEKSEQFIEIIKKYTWTAQYHNYYCNLYCDNREIVEFSLLIESVGSRDFSRIKNNTLP